MPRNPASAEPTTAVATVRYSDHVPVDENTRFNLCLETDCAEHRGGDIACPVPETWGAVREWVAE